MTGLQTLVEDKLATKPSALKHVLADLGWVAKDAKWGGKDYKRVLWLHPEYDLRGGNIVGPGNWEWDTDPVRSSKTSNDRTASGFFTREQQEPVWDPDEPFDDSHVLNF
jgi:hypothetical protein